MFEVAALLFVISGYLSYKAKKNGTDNSLSKLASFAATVCFFIWLFSPKPITEPVKPNLSTAQKNEIYSEQVDRPYYKAHGHYDSLVNQWNDILYKMETGELDRYSAYSKFDELNGQFNRLVGEIRDIGKPDIFNSNQQEDFNILKDETEVAASYMRDATKLIADALDTGEVTPKNLEKITNKTSDANNFITNAIEAKEKLDSQFGVINVE